MDTKEKTITGLIGVGRRGETILRELLQIKGVQVVAIADPAAEAEHIARQLGVFYYAGDEGYERILEREDIEAVVVATSTKLHYPITAKALASAKDVFVEKPICETPKEGMELSTLATEHGRILTVGHSERFNPLFVVAVEKLRDLGSVLMVEARRVQPPHRPSRDNVIRDLGVHEFDLIPRLVGQQVQSVWAKAGNDRASVTMSFANQTIATVTLHRFSPERERQTVVTCESGVLKLDYLGQKLHVCRLRPESGEPELQAIQPTETKQFIGRPLRAILEDFLSATANRRPPVVTAKDAVEALRIALAAIKSTQTGREVYVVTNE